MSCALCPLAEKDCIAWASFFVRFVQHFSFLYNEAMASYRPIILVVLDGFGISEEVKGNPIKAAHLPTFDLFDRQFPLLTLQASSVAVGLPYGEAGNSEVGHLIMGAGRALFHHLPRIISSIKDETFYSNEALKGAAMHVKKNGSSLHIVGLVSSGSVHSYIEHFWALLECAKREGLTRVYVHAVTDGRDAPPSEGAEFIRSVAARMQKEYPFATVVSLVGREYVMDREARWERIQKGYNLFVGGVGTPYADPATYIRSSYGRGVYDENIEPGFLGADNGVAVGRISAGDALVFFNFREDSMREIAEVFVADVFPFFERRVPDDLFVVTMTEYKKGMNAHAAFLPLEIHWPLARVLSDAGKTQLHIAEMEKYAHVTYFFNGGIEEPFKGEARILIDSPRALGFEEAPEMNAAQVADLVLEHIDAYDFILVNFANADMVGHTGNFDAVVRAVEVLDAQLSRLAEAVLLRNALMVITGDHGNAERKIHALSGEKLTEHTTDAVPFYLIGANVRLKKERIPDEVRRAKSIVSGMLTDVAPTIIELMELQKPEEMSGKGLMGEWEKQII